MRLLVLVVLWCPSLGLAHDLITTRLTWSREVSRIVFHRCASCHRQGGPAPMPLTTYEQARPWAKAIKEEVLERRMPPWGAVKGFGDFRPDDSLTQDEIGTLADWVEGGAPEGDPKYLPGFSAPVEKSALPGWGSGVEVKDGTTLRASLHLGAIRPLDGSDATVIARLPDDSVQPLIWLHEYQPRWRRTFILREPLVLPAGTRFETGGVRLLLLPVVTVRPPAAAASRSPASAHNGSRSSPHP